MHAAQKAGATPEEIMEVLNFIGSWIGVRRLLGLEAWRTTFRPDLPTIDRVVELKLYTLSHPVFRDEIIIRWHRVHDPREEKHRQRSAVPPDARPTRRSSVRFLAMASPHGMLVGSD